MTSEFYDLGKLVEGSEDTLNQLKELRAENEWLRIKLAIHYCSRLYTDDGELQDNTAEPVIDFKRDDFRKIDYKMRQRLLIKLEPEDEL